MVRGVLCVSMVPTELWLAIAAFFGTTLSIAVYFRTSGAKLETRINRIVEEKKSIITESYLEVAERIVKRFKTTRTLSDELEEELEEISRIRFQLSNVPDRLSEIVDKLTFSILDGIGTVFFTISFAYVPNMTLEPMLSTWVQIILGAIMFIFVYRYFIGGLEKVRSLRNFEKLVNEIERCRRFDQLQELL